MIYHLFLCKHVIHLLCTSRAFQSANTYIRHLEDHECWFSIPSWCLLVSSSKRSEYFASSLQANQQLWHKAELSVEGSSFVVLTSRVCAFSNWRHEKLFADSQAVITLDLLPNIG